MPAHPKNSLDSENPDHIISPKYLVKLEQDRITVLVPGRLLVRNICMVFDGYQQQRADGPKFSRTI